MIYLTWFDYRSWENLLQYYMTICLKNHKAKNKDWNFVFLAQ